MEITQVMQMQLLYALTPAKRYIVINKAIIFLKVLIHNKIQLKSTLQAMLQKEKECDQCTPQHLRKYVVLCHKIIINTESIFSNFQNIQQNNSLQMTFTIQSQFFELDKAVFYPTGVTVLVFKAQVIVQSHITNKKLIIKVCTTILSL